MCTDCNPEFINDNGHPVILNRDWVVAVKPHYAHGDAVPTIGMTDILSAMPLPNFPGVGNIIMTVRGDYQEVGYKLGLSKLPASFTKLGDTLPTT